MLDRYKIKLGAKEIIVSVMESETGKILSLASSNRYNPSKIKQKDIENLKTDGTIHGGMVPKVDACLEALDGGVQKAHIIDGRIEHSLLLELFTTDGVGTEITK